MSTHEDTHPVTLFTCFDLGATLVYCYVFQCRRFKGPTSVADLWPIFSPTIQIMEVDTHIGAAMSGLIADARTLVDHARVEAQNHRFTYDEPMRVEALTQAVCDLALSFGEVRGKSSSRMGNGFCDGGFEGNVNGFSVSF